MRALAIHRRRGGNAANTAVVLAQLLPVDRVRWMGCLPAASADAQFGLDDLSANGVDSTLCERVAGVAEPVGVPTALIISSRATGSRTIVSSRRGLRELSPSHFAAGLPSEPQWVHLEAREPRTVGQMAQEVADRRKGGAAHQPWRLSIEIEKPAITVGDALSLVVHAEAAFFSRDWIEAHAAELLKGSEDTAGTDTAGTDTAGTDTAGTDTAGTDTDAAASSGGAAAVADHIGLRCLRALEMASDARAHVDTNRVDERVWIVGWGVST